MKPEPYEVCPPHVFPHHHADLVTLYEPFTTAVRLDAWLKGWNERMEAAREGAWKRAEDKLWPTAEPGTTVEVDLPQPPPRWYERLWAGVVKFWSPMWLSVNEYRQRYGHD
jgi:hypothetical protein